MATRSLTSYYLPTNFPLTGSQNWGTADLYSSIIKKEIGHKILNSKETLLYQPKGTDTFTFGDQISWIRLIELSTEIFPFSQPETKLGFSLDMSTLLESTNLLFKYVENIEKEIVNLFGRVNEVNKIYSEGSIDHIDVYIFITSQKYDRNLMDILLDQEIEILERFPDIDINFNYPPSALISNIEDAISSEAKLIFNKG